MEGRKKLLVSSILFWGDNKRVGLHYLTDFFIRRGFDVFWLTVPFSLLFFIKPTYIQEKVERLKLALSKGKEYEIGDSKVINGILLSAVHPIGGIPFLNSYFVIKNYLKLSYPLLGHLLKKYGFEKPDIFLFDTGGLNGDLLQFITPQSIIYRLNDEVSGFYNDIRKEAPGRSILENEYFKKSDLILAASKPLHNYAVQKRDGPKGVYLLPNGVDVERFLKVEKEPAEYKKIPKPRAVYVGGLRILDWNLIALVAKKNKSISFIVIGPGKAPGNLPKNIYFLGEISCQKIPAYMQHSEVGLMPVKNVLQIQKVERPLKFYEYLASGLPIVSVTYGKLKEGMSPYALFGNTPDEFSAAIQRALAYSPEQRAKLKEAAKQFSWDKIYKDFEKILEENDIFQ